jgi:hypothetical protein
MKFFPYFLCITLLVSCATPAPPRNEYFVADFDPIETGTVSLGIPSGLGGKIRVVDVPVTYNPRTNVVSFEFIYQTITYRQFWTTPNRAALLSALSRYQADFDARNLPLKSRSRMGKTYGSLIGTAEWAQFKFSVISFGYPNVDLGYIFVENSPYFLITQWSAQNIREGGAANSLRIPIYLTRAMAKEMADALSQETLLSHLPAPPELLGPKDLEMDEY